MAISAFSVASRPSKCTRGVSLSQPFVRLSQKTGCIPRGSRRTSSRVARAGGTENGPKRIFGQEKESAPDDLKYMFADVEFITYERRRGQRETMIERLKGNALGYSPRMISGPRGTNQSSPSKQEEQEPEQEPEPEEPS
jgi:hypothetical protein